MLLVLDCDELLEFCDKLMAFIIGDATVARGRAGSGSTFTSEVGTLLLRMFAIAILHSLLGALYDCSEAELFIPTCCATNVSGIFAESNKRPIPVFRTEWFATFFPFRSNRFREVGSIEPIVFGFGRYQASSVTDAP